MKLLTTALLIGAIVLVAEGAVNQERSLLAALVKNLGLA
jgi:hypothetical protein